MGRRLPRGVESALFRVAQEARGNAHRHLGGTQVQVTLATGDRPGGVLLVVRDNARGLARAQDASADDAEDTVPFGVGQIGMRERIHQLGGRLALRPAVPSGTVVEGWVTIDLDLGPRRGAATAAGFCRKPRLSRRARRYQASAFETAGISEERQRQGRGQRTGFRCRPA